VGKFDYKALSYAIALFVALDFSVLAANYWIDDDLTQYAVSINLAGRQRMLSQRITKTLLELQQENSEEQRRIIDHELREAVLLFDRTLSGFANGGRVQGSNGEMVELQRIAYPSAAELVSEAMRIWQPVRANILPYIDSEALLPQDAIRLANRQMLRANLSLLDLMNRLTSSEEAQSIKRTHYLRGIQTGMFVFALLTFFVIVRRLHILARNAFRLGRHFAELATRDALTGLCNRMELNHALEREFDATRRKNGGMAVLLMDLDGFKQVNDTRGHEAGDEVLRVVAARISSVMRTDDIVARLGGDEFVMICPGMSDESSARIMSERLIAAINQPIEIGNEHVHVGVSVGIAFYYEDAHSADELVRQADQAMYAAKLAGRNRFLFFSGKCPFLPEDLETVCKK
jgi:diguanylate cyclase (GGDEF)-like protein